MRTLISWLGIGLIAFIAYTYGAKAGRGRYRDIRASIGAAWDEPRVKKARKLAAKKAAKQARKLGLK